MESIKLNLIPGSVLPIVHASQYDNGRMFRAYLYNGPVEYIVSTDIISIRVSKPDGKIATASVPVVPGNNYVDITLNQQMCAVYGKCLCELNIKKDSVNIGTSNFNLEVEIDAISSALVSKSVIDDLDTLVDKEVSELMTDYTNVLPVETTPPSETVVFNGAALPIKVISVDLDAVQESGTPTPQSPKAITPINSVTINHNSDSTVIDLLNDYYGGALTITDGKVAFTSNKKKVNLSDLTYTRSNNIFVTSLSDGQIINDLNVIDYMCTTYLVKGSQNSSAYSSEDYVLWHGKSANKNQVFIRDSRYTDATTFKANVTGELVYVSTETVSIPLDDVVINAVNGENTISVTNGITSVTYYVPVNKGIQDSSGNILYGKKWAVCGDSFTNGVLSTTIGTGKYYDKKVTYPWLIGNRNNMEIVKFFEGGRTLAFPASPGSFTNSLTYASGAYYYQNIPADVDYITIYLGINDEHHSSEDEIIPLGTISDSTTATYFGAWNVVLSWLIENRPNAHIGIIVTNGIENNDAYRQAQISIAQKYGIPYIDLNGDNRTPAMIRTSNPNIASSVKTALLNKWRISSNNPHPNDAAHIYESTFIEDFLRSI